MTIAAPKLLMRCGWEEIRNKEYISLLKKAGQTAAEKFDSNVSGTSQLECNMMGEV